MSNATSDTCGALIDTASGSLYGIADCKIEDERRAKRRGPDWLVLSQSDASYEKIVVESEK